MCLKKWVPNVYISVVSLALLVFYIAFSDLSGEGSSSGDMGLKLS
jgi:hypothetical protein